MARTSTKSPRKSSPSTQTRSTITIPSYDQFAPPLLHHSECYRFVGEWYLKNLFGNLHAQQDWELFAPIAVGSRIRTRSTIIERYRKRGRDYVVNETDAIDAEDGRLLVRGRTHQSFLPPKDSDRGEGFVVDESTARAKASAARPPFPTAQGEDLSPVEHTIDARRCWMFSGPGANYHTDAEQAKKLGFPRIVVQGMMSTCFVSQIMLERFGEGWLTGGKMSVKLTNVIWCDESVRVHGRDARGGARGNARARPLRRLGRQARFHTRSPGDGLGRRLSATFRAMPQREVARALDAFELRGRHLLVAVSGGLDSVSLLHLLLGAAAALRARALGWPRRSRSARGSLGGRDARFVGELATGLGLRFAVEAVDPRSLRDGGSSRTRPTLQEACRQLRYGALRRMADKLSADTVATAHTADDQAETVLLRLLRGCGPDALGGIPEHSADGRIVRPLLGVTRRALEEYAEAQRVPFREDASNESDDYARNRLRHHVLPQLERNFNPRLLRAVGNLAEAQRRDAEWIESAVASEFDRRVRVVEGQFVIEAAGWSELPAPLARRLAKTAR